MIWDLIQHTASEGSTTWMDTSLTTSEVTSVLLSLQLLLMAYCDCMILMYGRMVLTLVCMTTNVKTFIGPFNPGVLYGQPHLVLDSPITLSMTNCDSWGPRALEGGSASAEA